ncbi:hypothetical protein [Halorubellus sp. PRR65]|uniref:hypothetical protein n=1 Tax=Halorubellus sp. PRR65 TaxID=3098148 RepID=UPI002B25F234|nr:hypothetical protein [Halorubellus sp. PRR65]
MSRSEDEAPVERLRALVDRVLDDLGEDELAEAAAEFDRLYATTVEAYGEAGALDPEAFAALLDVAGEADDRARSHLVAVARQSLAMQAFYDDAPTVEPGQVLGVLSFLDDPDWRVRQTVLQSTFLKEPVWTMAAGGERWRAVRERYATALVDRLDDPVALVAARAASALAASHALGYSKPDDADALQHAASVTVWHPHPDEAVRSMLDGLATADADASIPDDVDARYALVDVLDALAEHEPGRLDGHADALRRLVALDDEGRLHDVATDALRDREH